MSSLLTLKKVYKAAQRCTKMPYPLLDMKNQTFMNLKQLRTPALYRTSSSFFLTRPDAVMVSPSVRYKIFLSRIIVLSATSSYSSVVQVPVWFLDLSTSADLLQSLTVPASGCRIHTNSGPYMPILYNYKEDLKLKFPACICVLLKSSISH